MCCVGVGRQRGKGGRGRSRKGIVQDACETVRVSLCTIGVEAGSQARSRPTKDKCLHVHLCFRITKCSLSPGHTSLPVPHYCRSGTSRNDVGGLAVTMTVSGFEQSNKYGAKKQSVHRNHHGQRWHHGSYCTSSITIHVMHHVP